MINERTIVVKLIHIRSMLITRNKMSEENKKVESSRNFTYSVYSARWIRTYILRDRVVCLFFYT